MNDTVQPPVVDLTDRATYRTWTTGVIRYSDLDPNGHVNNGAVNTFFEDGRVHFRRANFGPVGEADVLAGYVIVDFHARYLAAITYPGEVEMATCVAPASGRRRKSTRNT